MSGDPVLLAQALSNLIDNALKYAPVNGTIEVAVLKSDGKVEVSVSDNGPGIADSEKGKVVERFYRGDASRGTPGVGLGLSLVLAVAKLHGSIPGAVQDPEIRVCASPSCCLSRSRRCPPTRPRRKNPPPPRKPPRLPSPPVEPAGPEAAKNHRSAATHHLRARPVNIMR